MLLGCCFKLHGSSSTLKVASQSTLYSQKLVWPSHPYMHPLISTLMSSLSRDYPIQTEEHLWGQAEDRWRGLGCRQHSNSSLRCSEGLRLFTGPTLESHVFTELTLFPGALTCSNRFGCKWRKQTVNKDAVYNFVHSNLQQKFGEETTYGCVDHMSTHFWPYSVWSEYCEPFKILFYLG